VIYSIDFNNQFAKSPLRREQKQLRMIPSQIQLVTLPTPSCFLDQFYELGPSPGLGVPFHVTYVTRHKNDGDELPHIVFHN
jgi:hypothetical protein